MNVSGKNIFITNNLVHRFQTHTLIIVLMYSHFSNIVHDFFILYFMGKVMLTINWGPGFLFIGELGQQSKMWNLSATVFLVLH